MLQGLSVTVAVLGGPPAIGALLLRYARRCYVVTGLAQLEKWVGQLDDGAIADSQRLWVSQAGRGRQRPKDAARRESRTSRVGRAVRRVTQIWAELDYAQRRGLEIRTGVPTLKTKPETANDYLTCAAADNDLQTLNSTQKENL